LEADTTMMTKFIRIFSNCWKAGDWF